MFLLTVILQYMALSKLIIEYKIIKVVACFHKVRICCAICLWWSVTSLVLLTRNAVHPDFLILFLVPQIFHYITIISWFFSHLPIPPQRGANHVPYFWNLLWVSLQIPSIFRGLWLDHIGVNFQGNIKTVRVFDIVKFIPAPQVKAGEHQGF